MSLNAYLILSTVIFMIGMVGVIRRKKTCLCYFSQQKSC